MFADAIIHPLVVPAQDNQILRQRQGVRQGLREDFAVGRGKNHFIVVAFAFQLLNAAVHRFDLHHHPSLTAKGIVVHLAMLAQRPVAQIVHMDFHESFVLCTLQNGAMERRLQHFGQHGEYVDSHHRLEVIGCEVRVGL